MILRTTSAVALATAITALGLSTASAIMITESNAGGNTGTDNVLFNSIVNDATNPVQGTVSGNPGFIVNFNSTSDTLIADGGQATIDTADGDYTDLTISLADGATFTKLILNPIVSADGHIDFTVNYNVSNTTFTQTFTVGNGNNFFQVIAGAGETINFVTYSTTDTTFTNSGQFRIGGLAAPGGVPDGGATVALLGAALTGIGAARRFLFKS